MIQRLEDSLLSGISGESLNFLKSKPDLSVEEKIILINTYIELLEYNKANELIKSLKNDLLYNSDTLSINEMIIDFLGNKLDLLKSKYSLIIDNLKIYNLDNYENLNQREKTFLILITYVSAEAFLHLGSYDHTLEIIGRIESLIENTSISKPSLPVEVIDGLSCRIKFINCYFAGEIDKGAEYVQKGLEIYTKTNNTIYLAYFYNFLGIYSSLKGYFYTALDSYRKCLNYFESIIIGEDIQSVKYIAGIRSNIATILSEQGKLQEAIELTKNALQVYEQIGSESDIANFYNSLGCYYRDLRDFDKAEEYLYKAYEMRKKLNDPFEISESLLNICIFEEKVGRLKQNSISAEQFPKALESKIVFSNKLFIEGLINYTQKNYSEALEDLDKALETEGIEIANKNLINEYKAEILLEKNDFHNFKRHLKLWKAEAKKNNLIPSLFKVYLIDFRFELLFSNFMSAQVSLDRASDLAPNYSANAIKLVNQNHELLKKRKYIMSNVKFTSSNQMEMSGSSDLLEIKNYMKEITILLTNNG